MCVNFWVTLDDTVPPILLILLGEGELENAFALLQRFDAPNGVVLLDLLVQRSIDQERLALDAHLQMSFLNIDGQLLRFDALGDGDIHCQFLKSLLPGVFVGPASVAGVRRLSFWLLIFGLLSITVFVLFFGFFSICIKGRSYTWISLTSILLSLYQCSLFLGDLDALGLFSFLLRLGFSFFGSAFSSRFRLSLLLSPLNLLLFLLISIESLNVSSQMLIDRGHSSFLLRKEISFASEKGEHVVEKVINTLRLLHCSHKKSVKFITHLCFVRK